MNTIKDIIENIKSAMMKNPANVNVPSLVYGNLCKVISDPLQQLTLRFSGYGIEIDNLKEFMTTIETDLIKYYMKDPDHSVDLREHLTLKISAPISIEISTGNWITISSDEPHVKSYINEIKNFIKNLYQSDAFPVVLFRLRDTPMNTKERIDNVLFNFGMGYYSKILVECILSGKGMPTIDEIIIADLDPDTATYVKTLTDSEEDLDILGNTLFDHVVKKGSEIYVSLNDKNIM